MFQPNYSSGMTQAFTVFLEGFVAFVRGKD